uniref:Uncharacterized protein n=1 Tax=Borrelia hermsii TaxID=140 RepID=T1EC63_BORHE|nr:hypothetical protein BHA003 [Borrelia hermsii]
MGKNVPNAKEEAIDEFDEIYKYIFNSKKTIILHMLCILKSLSGTPLSSPSLLMILIHM